MKGLAYFGDQKSLPNNESVVAHTAEALHRVEGAKVVEGGWIGGNAWFGSITTVVEVKNRLGVDSTLIIKGNSSYYTMAALSAVLNARFGTKVAGH
jgi:hypothetical protein